MRCLTVTTPGPRTTVEDQGRARVGCFGIPGGGAFDGLALVAANRLVGNADEAAGLELTLGGPTLVNSGDETVEVAVVGADCGATVVAGNASRAVAPGTPTALRAGDTLRLGFARDGARAWIAVSGGVAVEPVLGSRSTCLPGRFGGLEGRPLRAGDVLPLGPRRDGAPGRAPLRANDFRAGTTPVTLRLLSGPQRDRFAADALASLCASSWRVDNDSDRTGTRLAAEDEAAREMLRGVAGIPPEGTTLGAVQVPPDGQPILLGPDRPVTGGYAKPALVIAADVGRLALLRPGDAVRFAEVSLEEALDLARRRRAALPEAAP